MQNPCCICLSSARHRCWRIHPSRTLAWRWPSNAEPVADGSGTQRATSTPLELQTSRNAQCRSHSQRFLLLEDWIVCGGINGAQCGDLCFDVLQQLLVSFIVFFAFKLQSEIVECHDVANCIFRRSNAELHVGLLGLFWPTWLSHLADRLYLRQW